MKKEAAFQTVVGLILCAVLFAVLLDIAQARQAALDAALAAVDAVNESNHAAGLDTGAAVIGPDLLPVAPELPAPAGGSTEDYNPAIPLSMDEQHALRCACAEFDIPVPLALGVIEQETNFRNVSGDGGDSKGYMQIQPRWWGGLMAQIGTVDLYTPEDNFRTGCAVLRNLIDRYGGDLPAALTAYNAGRDTGSRGYAYAVLGYAAAWEGGQG